MGVGNLYSMKMSFSNANGAPSYKDTIVGIRPTTVGPTTEESMTADEIINVVIEEICPTPFMDDNEIEKVKPINPFPEIEVNVEQYERWCGYWKHPLLVKLMGKKVNLNFISARLQKLWACIGTVQVLDLNHDFFLFRFSHEDIYGGRHLWGTTSIFISMVFSSTYHVHLHINPRSLNLWVFSTIYASPQLGNLVILWDKLCNIDNDGSNPWIVAGDVNQVLYQSEKHGGGFLNLSSATLLVDCLNDCNISELGFSSPPFTKKRGTLYKHLDRVVANVVAVEIPQFQSGLFSVPSYDHCWHPL